jgi:hypothetical protein
MNKNYAALAIIKTIGLYIAAPDNTGESATNIYLNKLYNCKFSSQGHVIGIELFNVTWSDAETKSVSVSA